jgi:hypothetical protein
MHKFEKLAEELKELVINEDGCPCCGTCCNGDSGKITPEHECSEDFCEDCYGTECLDCGACCHCDL